MKNSMIFSKFFYFNTKKKIDNKWPVYNGLVAYKYKCITIEPCINLHTIDLLPYFRIFWRRGYFSLSIGLLVFQAAVMVEDDIMVCSKEEGGEE